MHVIYDVSCHVSSKINKIDGAFSKVKPFMTAVKRDNLTLTAVKLDKYKVQETKTAIETKNYVNTEKQNLSG